MKLLLDENISRRLVPLLANAYPGSTHVVLQGLQRASDTDVWTFAEHHDYVVVSKDDDVSALSSLRVVRLASSSSPSATARMTSCCRFC